MCVCVAGVGRMVGVLDASYWPSGASESQCIENGPCILEAGGSSRAQTWRVGYVKMTSCSVRFYY